MTEEQILNKMSEILFSGLSEKDCQKAQMGTGMYFKENESEYRMYRVYSKNGFEFFLYFITENHVGGAVAHSLIPGFWHSNQLTR